MPISTLSIRDEHQKVAMMSSAQTLQEAQSDREERRIRIATVTTLFETTHTSRADSIVNHSQFSNNSINYSLHAHTRSKISSFRATAR